MVSAVQIVHHTLVGILLMMEEKYLYYIFIIVYLVFHLLPSQFEARILQREVIATIIMGGITSDQILLRDSVLRGHYCIGLSRSQLRGSSPLDTAGVHSSDGGMSQPCAESTPPHPQLQNRHSTRKIL